MNQVQHEFFARCAGGFEAVLAHELKALRVRQVRPLKGGAAFFGDVGAAYKACLQSRVATRIQLVLARVDADDARELYDSVAGFAWEDHVLQDATLAVHAHGQNRNLRNTQFTALKVKDAVCDRLRERRGARPDVDPDDPDFAIDVTLHGSKATLYLNLSGESLHRRGYREEGVQAEAPLKETLAAGMLIAARWDDLLAAEDTAQAETPKQASRLAFVDPMCGSGTLAIEAALIAARVAPGLLRNRWGFDGWALHDEETWQAVRAEAEACVRREVPGLRIVASDIDGDVVALARENARRAQVNRLVEFQVCDAAKLAKRLRVKPEEGLAPRGLMAVNPPYGQRLMSAGELPRVYEALASAAFSVASGWRLAAVTPDASLDSTLGLTPDTVLDCYNGAIPVSVRLYRAEPENRQIIKLVSLAGLDRTVGVSESGSGQFAARLRKVAKERTKWARKEGVSCYRIYDADLPDYALSVDLYQGEGEAAGERFLRVAEYKAPASIDPDLAARRFADALNIAPAVLDVEPGNVFSKVRRRDKGGGQYRDAQGRPFIVEVGESGFVFEADLNGRLDTGIFLDHRVTREMLGRMARGTRFLNLFAYTGTATVHAAGGGAWQTTTVDLSQTYLSWAQRNMHGNGFWGKAHRFERADVMKWLEGAAYQHRTFELVFCDPPTFSNSKSRSARTFDVQRDHVELLRRVGAVLAGDGAAVFSCNLRSFKLDVDALHNCGLVVRDITSQTIPHDFGRNPKIHRCFLVAKSQDVLEGAAEAAGLG